MSFFARPASSHSGRIGATEHDSGFAHESRANLRGEAPRTVT
jgi:hypothetical protein